MRRINSKRDLPSWFNISNYEKLTTIDDDQILRQFRVRYWLLLLDIGDKPSQDPPDSSEEWMQIIQGRPVVDVDKECSGIETKYYSSMDESEARLKGCEAVSGIDFSFLTNLPYMLEDLGLATLEANKHYKETGFKYDVPDNTHRDVNFVCKPFENILGGDALVSINLKYYNDIELLTLLKELIPQWRQQLDLKEPPNFIGKPSAVKRLLKYRVIPYLDLKIWGKFKNVTIPHKISVLALYPEGERGEIEFVQTVLPFVNKILEDGFRWKAELENME